MNTGITAASGRLGTALLEALAAKNADGEIRAIARSPERVTQQNITTRAADYSDESAMTAAFEGLDTLILISAPVGAGDRVALHRNALRAAETAGVRRVIFTSVIGNGLEMDTRFGITQQDNRQTEADLAASGLHGVTARNGIYLDLDIGHIAHAAGHGGVYRNNGGDGRCCYISIAALAEALAGMVHSDLPDGSCYNLVGEAATQAELVALTNQEYGFDVRFEGISAEANIARMEPERGRLVAEMLTGCFDAISLGAFDVPSDYAGASGSEPPSLAKQIKRIHEHAATG